MESKEYVYIFIEEKKNSGFFNFFFNTFFWYLNWSLTSSLPRQQPRQVLPNFMGPLLTMATFPLLGLFLEPKPPFARVEVLNKSTFIAQGQPGQEGA